MAQAVIFPKLGQTMEEGAIVKWLKKEGDTIAKGDILFEIETDKANLEVESFFEGKLLKIYVGEGIMVPVNTVVAYVGAADEPIPPPPPPPQTEKAPPVAEPPPVPQKQSEGSLQPPTQEAAPPPPPVAAPPAQPPAPKRLVISPRAKKLVFEKAISAERITGTGPSGRITEKDVQAYLVAQHYDDLRITPAAKRLAQQAGVDILALDGSGDKGRIMVEDVERAKRCLPVPLSRMRQVIARRLVESKQNIPHFYVTVSADLTELAKFRAALKARGENFSVNDFILQAVVLSLEEFPVVNSTTDGRTVAWRGDVALGVAVSVENGLVVPVVRRAQTLSFAELRDQVRRLAAKARDGRLTPDEMTGSSFSVSNMGMLDVDSFTAIINPGEAGILAVSSAREVPCAVNGEIRVRTKMSMTLSADHRIIDGATAAQFTNAIRAKLEDMSLWQSLV